MATKSVAKMYRAALSIISTLIFLSSFLTTIIVAAPAVNDENQALSYLSRFGYLEQPQDELSARAGFMKNDDTVKKAIRDFQEFAGLNLTERIDGETLTMMKSPRCGVKDRTKSPNGLSSRYVLEGSKWKINNLTYTVTKYPSGLSRSDTDDEIRKAFTAWSEITPLTFTRKNTGKVHIEIRFEEGNHDDDDPFDGPGQTLAHAYFPESGGDVHFDDSERWTVRSKRGTNLFQVAVHEFGHALGLEHSRVRSAIMFPFYRGYLPDFEFDHDDIEGIQALYGRRSRSSSRPNPSSGEKSSPRDSDRPDLCKDAKIDAIFDYEGYIYVLKGAHYWKIGLYGIEEGYPQLISRLWNGLPRNIDAAFSGTNGKIYFFKGSKYWRYNGKSVDRDYPKEITNGFVGIPNNIDAAVWWHPTGEGYFFKGSQYWVYDPNKKPEVDFSYPKSIKTLRGIPSDLDDILYMNKTLFFFKDGRYYRSKFVPFEIDNVDPPYPRNTKKFWFSCNSSG